MRTYGQQDEFLKCCDYILHALSEEQAKRKFRQYADWIECERLAVTIAANEWAVSHAPLRTVTEAEVEAVEAVAVGHVDYSRKWALYVTELVYQ